MPQQQHHTLPAIDEQGQSLDVVAWLQALPAGTQSRQVVFEHEGQREAFRLIACPLEAEAAERARAKARRKASPPATRTQSRDAVSGGLAARLHFPADPELVR
jgi:hypothetical protein